VFVAGSSFLRPTLALEASTGNSCDVWKNPFGGDGRDSGWAVDWVERPGRKSKGHGISFSSLRSRPRSEERRTPVISTSTFIPKLVFVEGNFPALGLTKNNMRSNPDVLLKLSADWKRHSSSRKCGVNRLANSPGSLV
jgi:hypothetical protein